MVILDFKGLLMLIDEANDQKGFNDQENKMLRMIWVGSERDLKFLYGVWKVAIERTTVLHFMC